MRTNPPCPYCSSRLVVCMETRERDYLRCSRCGLVTRRDNVTMGGGPESGYLDDRFFEEAARDQLDGHRNGIYHSLLDEIEAILHPGRLLDVGCGCGFFLKTARSRGWDIRGIDPSRKSMEHLRRMLGNVGVEGPLETFPEDERFDAVTMLNVLDHLEEPWKAVEKVSRLLRPGGLFLLRIPNGSFHAAALRLLLMLGPEAAAWRLTVIHRYALTPGFLERLLSAREFTGIRVRNARLTENVQLFGRRGDPLNGMARSLLWAAVRSVELASAGRFRVGPSLSVTARKK